MKPLQIAYITETSTDDKHAWSGTAHYVYKALLKQGFKVHALGPAKPGIQRLALAIANKTSLAIFKKRIDYRHSSSYSKMFGRIFDKKLSKIEHDLIVVCGGTEYGAYLKTNKPVYYVLDRTIAGAINYHTILSDLWAFSKHQSIETDKKAMQNAMRVFFSSEWAADHARKFYLLSENKIRVIPFGANLDLIPDRATALKQKNITPYKLLLVGTYWINKGADIALKTMRILRQRGIDVVLTVVGCTPPETVTDKHLSVIPFIDKNSQLGLQQLSGLFLDHHFFILPTRFDCTPIVYCEASAFGLPILSSDTGGVAGHIKNGVNGYLLPYHDQGEAYADKITELINDPGKYKRLCESSRSYFESTLNWDAWGAEFKKDAEAIT